MMAAAASRHFVAILAILASIVVPSGFARADGEGESVYKKLLRSTVWVIVPQTDELPPSRPGQAVRIPIATGSGSLIDEKAKLVLTNYHVVGERDQAFILFPTLENGKPVVERNKYLDKLKRNEAIPAKVKRRDAKRDLALLELAHLPGGAKAIHLARESADPGQRVHSMGNTGASGALWGYTSGTVRTAAYKKTYRSGLGRGQIMDLDAFVIETQSPTNQGDSGGPLVNDYGELVAVTQGGIVNAQQVSLFIDIREVVGLLSSAKIRPHYANRRGKDSKATALSDNEAESETAAKKSKETEEQKNERLATAKLRYVKIFIRNKMTDSAREYCEQILTDFPMTKTATEAKMLLEELKTKK